MTRTYHDVEAVTRLLQEKEKDLELAAQIGHELLKRNCYLDEKISTLETHAAASNDLITQLRHDLSVKTDLLRLYTSDDTNLDEGPVELRNINIDAFQKRIKELEEDNKKLQEEASELSKEAYEFEEKEEKLVSDAVKHLTEANVQISYLSEEYTVKQDESYKLKEEITHLLAQVCDLQAKVRTYSQDNDDLGANLRIYKETQEELTTELVDFKEKYREAVDLLKDAQEELKVFRKKGLGYAGIGSHNIDGMFPSKNEPPNKKEKGDSLLDEIHDTLRTTKTARNEISEAEMEFSTRTGSGSNQYLSGGTAYSRTFNTYKYANRAAGYLARTASENAFGSYTISRDNSYSDLFDIGHLSKDPSSMPLANKSIYGSSVSILSSHKEEPNVGLVEFEIKESFEEDDLIKTVGELSLPTKESKRNLHALQMPLGYVPGQDKPSSVTSWLESSPDIKSIPGGIPLGSVPGEHSFGTALNNSTRQNVPLGSVPGNYQESSQQMSEACKIPSFTAGRRGSLPADCQTSKLTLPPEALPVGVLGSVPLGSVPGFTRISEPRSDEGLLRPANDLTLPPESLPVGVLGPVPLGSVPGMKEFKREASLESATGLTLPPESLPLGILGTAPLGSVPNFSKGNSKPCALNEEVLEHVYDLTLRNDNTKSTTPREVGTLEEDKSRNQPPVQERSASSAITGSWDSGVLSGDYNEVRGGAADGTSEVGDIEFTVPTHSGELEKTLRKLNPADIERRRRKLRGPMGSYDLGSEGYGSPPDEVDYAGSLQKETRKSKYNLPYGVRTPDSTFSSEMKNWCNEKNVKGNINQWKVPNKLRIVKPLEGSLTLHNWSQLARPSLGGILEEKSGIVIKGGNAVGIACDDPSDLNDFSYSNFDRCNSPDSFSYSKNNYNIHKRKDPDTGTQHTITNSTVIHPENPETTSTYSEYQLASGFFGRSKFPSRSSSRLSSRMHSVSDLRHVGSTKKFINSGQGTSTFSTNMGIASLLNERNIHGGSNLSLYEPSGMSGSIFESSTFGSVYEPSIYGSMYEPSLYGNSTYEPSIISTSSRLSSRKSSRRGSIVGLENIMEEFSSFSPTSTPANSPLTSPPGEPSGIVQSFFASLKASLYGTSVTNKHLKKSDAKSKLSVLYGIGPKKKQKSLGILKKVKEVGVEKMLSHSSSCSSILSDFDEVLLQECEELQDIVPGSLTIRQISDDFSSREGSCSPPPLEPVDVDVSGVLIPPSFTTYGRPSLNLAELGTVPSSTERGPGLLNPDNLTISSFGVPGIPGTDALSKVRPDLGTVPEILSPVTRENRSMKTSSGFMGNITTMFFGRKGGLL